MKNLFKNHWPFILAFLLVLWVFQRWLTPGIITWGDWWPETIDAYRAWLNPNLWSGSKNFGFSMLKEFSAPVWMTTFTVAAYLNELFGLNYAAIERIIWYFPYLILAPVSFYFFWRTFFPDRKLGIFAGILFFSINTYTMLQAIGGGINMMIIYALIPAILAFLKRYTEKERFQDGILLGLFTSLGIVYELRGVFILGLLVVSYLLIFLRQIGWKIVLRAFSWFILVPFLLNLWWLMPFVLQSQKEILPPTYDNIDWVLGSSYTDLAHGITLFHQQWYNNILGTINPIPPIFYFIPLLLVAGIYWSRKYPLINFFTIAALVTIFLVKGANPPLGAIYVFLFKNFPGFSAFRDSSKFFLILALSYSVLFAFFIDQLGRKFKTYTCRNIFVIVLSLLPIIWLYPAFSQKVGGTFNLIKQTPFSYQQFAQILNQDKNFYRTLWLPKAQRFAYFSEDHPKITLDSEIHNTLSFLKNKTERVEDIFTHPISEYILADAGVKYLVIPEDAADDIYKDYEPKEFYTNLADQTEWLKKNNNFNLSVYEINKPESIIYARNNWLATDNFSNQILSQYLNEQKQKLALVLTKSDINPLITIKANENQPYLFQLQPRAQSKTVVKENRKFDFNRDTLVSQPIFITSLEPASFYIPEEIWPQTTNWRVDGKVLTQSRMSVVDPDYIELLLPKLTIGEHQLQFNKLLGNNLLEVKSNNQLVFDAQSSLCSNDPSTGLLSNVNLKKEENENEYIEIKTYEYASCLARHINLPKGQSQFLLSFDYQNKTGDPGWIIIRENNAKAQSFVLYNDFKNRKDRSVNWYNWSKIINLSPESTSVTISYILPYFPEATIEGTNKPQSEVWLDNLQFQSFPASNLEKISYGFLPKIETTDLSKVSITKINNGQYQAEISGTDKPQLLVLNYQYNQDWQLLSSDQISASKNIKVNGITNSFIIDPKNNPNYTVTLKYRMQGYVLPGLTISFISLIILIFIYFKKKKHG